MATEVSTEPTLSDTVATNQTKMIAKDIYERKDEKLEETFHPELGEAFWKIPLSFLPSDCEA